MPLPSERPISGKRFAPKSKSATRSRRTISPVPIFGIARRIARLARRSRGDQEPMRKKPLGEQIVVVTGASSGLGRAIARLAGERGAKVVVTARNAEALDNAAAEIEASGSEALAVPADQTLQDEVAKVVEQAIGRFGRIGTDCAHAVG